MANSSKLLKKVLPKRVDFHGDSNDHFCGLYGAMGMSTRFIQDYTGLSPSQISYRLKLAGLTKKNGASRTDFRNGVSPFSKAFIKLAPTVIEKDFEKFLDENLA